MSVEVVVGVLRREVTAQEEAALREKYPGRELRFIRLDSGDHLEHAKLCRKWGIDVVLLPLERPIPATAMEDGVPHVALMIDGLKELLPLRPEFGEFEPEA